MEKEVLLEIVNDAENKSNKNLFEASEILMDEFEKTKSLIIELTRHMDGIEVMYNKVNDEIKKRVK